MSQVFVKQENTETEFNIEANGLCVPSKALAVTNLTVHATPRNCLSQSRFKDRLGGL